MGTGGAVNQTSGTPETRLRPRNNSHTGNQTVLHYGPRIPLSGTKHSLTGNFSVPSGELKAPLNGPHQSPESKTLFDLLTHTPNAARKNVCVSHCLRARDIYELINAPHGGAHTLRIENDDKRKVFGKAADRLQKDRLQHRKDAGAE